MKAKAIPEATTAMAMMIAGLIMRQEGTMINLGLEVAAEEGVDTVATGLTGEVEVIQEVGAAIKDEGVVGHIVAVEVVVATQGMMVWTHVVDWIMMAMK